MERESLTLLGNFDLLVLYKNAVLAGYESIALAAQEEIYMRMGANNERTIH